MKLILLVIATLFPGSVVAQSINGVWQTEISDKGAHLLVRIGDCANSAGEKCGIIIEVVNSESQTSLGKPIIWAMKPDGPNKWSGGKIWAPDNDKTYRANMRYNGDSLRVEGCVTVFCRGQTWSRVD